MVAVELKPVEIVLRDYQEECVKRILDAYERDNHGTELIVLPTGGGKTIVFCAVIDALNKQYGLNTLLIAHRDELLDQGADKYRLIKPHAVIGKVGSGIHNYGGEVTVASIATISRPEHIKRLKQIGFGLIIVDEAHHVAAAGYQKVLEALPDAFKLFVTATPDRLDGKPILAGKAPIYSANIIEMIQQGYLCNVRSIATKTDVNLDELHTSMGDFQTDELEKAVDIPARNRLIVAKYQEFTPGKRAVAFCVTVHHAQNLARAFNEAGIKAATISGDTPLDERKRIYKAFRAGDILVMTNVMVLSEGWDEPLCEVGIGARPTQSRALFVQQLGRILRLAPGKSIATWLDLTDNCLKHRLEPQSLRKVLNIKTMQDDETLIEAVEREQEEKKSGKAVLRKLKENRSKDMQIDLMQKLEWLPHKNGMFVLTVGAEQHRIALVPSQEDGYYSVWARLFPGYEAQMWLADSPLDWAQQVAEKEARKLLADPNARALVDRNAPWRNYSPTPGQLGYLRRFRIRYDEETLTRGQASELIDKHQEKLEQKKVRAGA